MIRPERSASAADPKQAGVDSGHGVDRRTLLKGAAWSLPVAAVSVSTPLAAASTAPGVFDLVYVTGPDVSSTTVSPGDTPFVDFTVQNTGPDDAPSALVTFSVPSANNDPGATSALPNDGASPGWTLSAEFSEAGRDYYSFIMAPMPVGQQVVRWRHVVGGAVNTSYTINANLSITSDETDTGNNGGSQPSALISVVA